MGVYASREVLDGLLDVLVWESKFCCGTFGNPQSLSDVQQLLGSGGMRVTEELNMLPADFSKRWVGLDRELVMARRGAEVFVESQIDHLVLYDATKILEVTVVDTTGQDPLPVGSRPFITDWTVLAVQPA